MERYKFTFADGSNTEEFFESDNEAIVESDNEAIVAATAANGGSSWGLYVQRYDHRGSLLPTKLPPGGHRGTWCPKIGMPSPALVAESAVDPARSREAFTGPRAG